MSSRQSPEGRQAPHGHRLPAVWRRRDIERAGLPRYAADDQPGIRGELRDGAGFVLVHGLLDGIGADASSAAAAARLREFGRALGRLLAQNHDREDLVEIADFSDVDDFDDRRDNARGAPTGKCI